VKRQVNVHKLSNQPEIAYKLTPIPMRDLTVNKVVDENESTGLIEARHTEVMRKGQSTHIEDITSG